MIFLPYPDLQSSARCLDSQLLGKSRWEVRRLLSKLMFDKSWPLRKTWETEWIDYEFTLVSYGFELCREWILRGNVDTIQASLMDLNQLVECKIPPEPNWLSNKERLQIERKTLFSIYPSWYKRYWNREGIENGHS